MRWLSLLRPVLRGMRRVVASLRRRHPLTRMRMSGGTRSWARRERSTDPALAGQDLESLLSRGWPVAAAVGLRRQLRRRRRSGPAGAAAVGLSSPRPLAFCAFFDVSDTDPAALLATAARSWANRRGKRMIARHREESRMAVVNEMSCSDMYPDDAFSTDQDLIPNCRTRLIRQIKAVAHLSRNAQHLLKAREGGAGKREGGRERARGREGGTDGRG